MQWVILREPGGSLFPLVGQYLVCATHAQHLTIDFLLSTIQFTYFHYYYHYTFSVLIPRSNFAIPAYSCIPVVERN